MGELNDSYFHRCSRSLTGDILRNRKTQGIYEFDGYKWLEESILQLVELRRKLELDMPNIAGYKIFISWL